jgi:DNA segregation ATPase FtsK/SpoIIIE-like protein
VQSPVAKTLGAIWLLMFVPALLAICPDTALDGRHPDRRPGGRIVGDVLIRYLNVAGAYIVCTTVLAVALYLTTAFSFSAIELWAPTRFAFVLALRDRFPRLAGRARAQASTERTGKTPRRKANRHRATRARARGRASAGIYHAPKLRLVSAKLPSTTLLHRPDDPSAINEAELKVLAQVLAEKCGEFDVRGQVVQINPGPVVTTFEFKPEAGIKYSRITNLCDDLCLALRAESILIERMSGKSTVGIQVPNHERETIWLREVVEAQEFLGSKSKLTLALGKDINGRIVCADLNAMPHLLIAGSTGSGKSVAINAFIMSILYKATPQEVRLILVDPKRLELGNYEGVPHLHTPIITEPKLASNALRNAVLEMERRLKVLAEKGVRNIDQYNKLFDNSGSLFDEGGDDARPLPYIVIIIDELADLMMLDGQNVEASITRLAQMARAVGIHLVLATQRPSVDVITGLIKANFPARISFRVATKVDSRTILDANGAEALLGRGDMLYLPNGSARVHRVHAPLVTEKEIAAVVEFWRSQGTAQYQEHFLQAPRDEGATPKLVVRTEAVRAATRTTNFIRTPCALCWSTARLRLRYCSAVCASATAAPPTSST